MKTIKSEIIIQAPASVIWDQLITFSSYAEWNPFIHIKGIAKLDSQIEIKLFPEEQKPQIFKPIITELKPGKSLRWLGSLFVKGLFDGEHYFQLEALGRNKTRFIHGENFNGILSGMIMKMIEEKTKVDFEKMNAALKERSEKKETVPVL